MKKKIALGLILPLILLAIFWQLSGTSLKSLNKVLSSQTEKNAVIVISHAILSRGKTTPEFKKMQVKAGSTELEILKRIAVVKTTGEGKDAFVTSINNQEATAASHEFWSFYVNGKPSEVGAGSYVLRQGDKINWQIEKY